MSGVLASADGEADAREMDILLARAGLAPIPDRRDALLAGFRDLKRHLGVLRNAADERSSAASEKRSPDPLPLR